MAVSMNKRECLWKISIVLLVLLGMLKSVTPTTSTPVPATTDNTTIAANTTTNTTVATTTTAPTTTTIATTTTTTLVPPGPGRHFDQNTLIGQCPCDLTGNACDVNCCCDEYCGEDDKATFSQCLPFSVDVDDRLCFRKEIILFENSNPVTSEITDDDLFCIYYDNKEERNYYTIPDIVTSQTLPDYQKEFHSFSYQSDPVTTINFASSFYKSGDHVYTVFESLAVGYLSLPHTLTSTDCVDGNPAAYLLDETYTCVRSIENSASCSASLPAIDANNYITGFRVVKSPQMFQEFNITIPGTSDFYSLFNNSFTTGIELDRSTAVDPIQCIDDTSGLIGPCNYNDLPSPSLQAGGTTCNDVVRQVHYRMITDGTTGIVQVLARFVLGNVALSSPPSVRFTQSFSTTFEASSSSETFQWSGNPGYVVGQPVLAGTLNLTTEGNEIHGQILMNSNRNRYMTVVRSSASGDCVTDSDDRISVVFGLNVRSGCMLRVSADNLTQYCALMQQKIMETMEYDGIPETIHVGLYGDSHANETGEWVKVLYQNRFPPTPPQVGTHNCQLTLGMHIQILYADIGALINPQPKIIGVSFIYDSPTSVQIRPTLAGGYNQPVEVTASVTFIDVSKPAVGYQGEPPIFLAKVPYDFFYPFISGSGTPTALVSGFLPLVTILLVICQLL